MKITNILIPACLLLTTMYSCKQDVLLPVEHDGTKPGPVSNIKVESRPGTVKLTYTLPADPDLLYVLGEYTDKYGKLIQNKASFYSDSMVVQGFADSAVYKMNLYAVDRSENKSAPVTIDVRASSPPIFGVKANLLLQEDFGGINVQFSNPNEADLAIVVSYKDSLGFFVENETFYTKLKQGAFTSRGLSPKPTVFGVYIRDRWNNRTDTIFKTLTPIFEKELDKTKFKAVILPSDVANYGNGLVIEAMWDGKINEGGNMWHSISNGGMPMHITVDLGVTAKLSRFTLWQRPGPYLYNHGNPKRYEIWGAVTPAADGSFSNWTLLQSFVSVKPSAGPTGVNTKDDVDAAARGEENNIPLNAPKIRYLRIKILENWSGGSQGHIAEMKFFGNDI
ncbi:MAG: DUF5126 domain-containing protein [Ferruginibacter sp.]|nr:DUF5126 domain-containing protein [Ferruginibacter sp.]